VRSAYAVALLLILLPVSALTGCRSADSKYERGEAVACSDDDDDDDDDGGSFLGAVVGGIFGALFESAVDSACDDARDRSDDSEKPRPPQYPIRVRGNRNYEAATD
jgi:hypothetical protein